MSGPPDELSEIRSSAYEAIDRSRNTRQITLLLTYVSGMIRGQSVIARNEYACAKAHRAEAACSQQDNCVRVPAEAPPQEEPKAGERKPMQSVRAIPSDSAQHS
jgi:hypothetical protein